MMSDSDDTTQTVSIEELRAWASLLLDHLDSVAEGNSVDVPYDYYWVVDESQRSVPHVDPTTFTLGQLSFDIDSLRTMREDGSTVSYGLVWLGEILRSIGASVVF
ncbi:MAG: hypothetical protein ABFR95_06280 [Actinomycetota bacterium]